SPLTSPLSPLPFLPPALQPSRGSARPTAWRQPHGPGVTTLTTPREPVRGQGEAADVALASAGDATAFERLYRAHVARVHGLARRMLGSVEEADEVTQDVFVRAWSKLGTFRGESQFGT